MTFTYRAVLSIIGIVAFATLLSITLLKQHTSTELVSSDSTEPPSPLGLPTPPEPTFAVIETEQGTTTTVSSGPKPTTTQTPSTKPPTQPTAKEILPPTTTSNEESFGTINTNTRAALVNILCSTKAGGAVRPFSGSGVIIDPRGIILTNAHLAQYMLLKDYPSKDSISCTVRMGSPARELYKADILYIPKKWIDAHAEDILATNPTGTGEHDYALLYITGSSNASVPLPTKFPYIDFDTTAYSPTEGAQLLIAAYPAEFVGSVATLRDLYISSSITPIHKIYTFSSDLPDLIGIVGSVVAQKGASGGAFVSDQGKLVGLVVTATDETSTGDRGLNAATLAHINRSMLAHTGGTLREFLAKDPKTMVAIFAANEFPLLEQKMIDALTAHTTQ